MKLNFWQRLLIGCAAIGIIVTFLYPPYHIRTYRAELDVGYRPIFGTYGEDNSNVDQNKLELRKRLLKLKKTKKWAAFLKTLTPEARERVNSILREDKSKTGTHKESLETVNIPLLLTEWLGIIIVTIMGVLVLAGNSTKEYSSSRESHRLE